jgi:hypothetical protein
MQSFRTELENPIVEQDIIDLERRYGLFARVRYTTRSSAACAWRAVFTAKGSRVCKWCA